MFVSLWVWFTFFILSRRETLLVVMEIASILDDNAHFFPFLRQRYEDFVLLRAFKFNFHEERKYTALLRSVYP